MNKTDARGGSARPASAAADAIEESRATRALPLQSEGIRQRYLPEDRALTKAQHLKIEYAIRV